MNLIHGDPIVRGSYDWYEDCWAKCIVLPSKYAMVARETDKLLKHKERYQQVEIGTQVPWQLLGAFHGVESDFDFSTYLGNSDPLHVKTTHVPAGRGPFLNWESGAFDALKFEGMIGLEWDIPSMLLMAEKWNGLGYLRYHPSHMSPYIWSCTNLETPGRYVEDGKFDPNGHSLQVGVAAYFKQLQILRQL